MSTLRDVETLLSKLSRAEKAQVLQWGVRNLGDAFEAQLLECYPSLRAEDLANAWAFERAHRGEIEEQIAENENA
ncbi:MAG: hypothetical protein WBC80_19775 [Isosphaeraceae bacterium]